MSEYSRTWETLAHLNREEDKKECYAQSAGDITTNGGGVHRAAVRR